MVKNKTEKAEKVEKKKREKKVYPEGQRTNSKQVDVIESGDNVVETYAYPIRKTGSLITTIVKGKDGKVISVSTVFIPGVKAKSKKGHGMIQPGVAGEGKKGKKEDDEEETSADEPKEKKSKKKKED